MRRAVRLILLCASLTLLVCAARAQPPEPPPPPRDEPCRTAGQKYARPFSDRSHRLHISVGQVNAAALGASRAEWKRLLGIFYAYRHEGDDTGLEETIARAFDAPMPKL